MAAVLEYITAEFLEAAGNVCLESKKSIITPKHINLGMRVDDCLDKLMVFATISQGGNLVHMYVVSWCSPKIGMNVLWFCY